jgi:hypothetical protein
LNSIAVAALAVILYSIKVFHTILTVTLTSLIVGPFVMLASQFASLQSEGAVPPLGYPASAGVSFILIFTSYVGARGAAQTKV